MEWLSEYGSNGKVKLGTVRIRKKEINRPLDYFTKTKLKNITGKQYQDALIDLKNRGYADNTMDGIHVTGRMIFKKAVKRGLIKSDPTDDAYVPRKQKTVRELENETKQEIPKYLEKEELALFLTTAEEKGLSRDYPAFVTLSHTGMRIGELCALQWKDIDFLNGTISITKTYINEKNNIKQYSLDLPKNKKARTIVVDEKTMEVLKRHKEHQDKIRMRYQDSYYDRDYIFAEESKEYAGYPPYLKKFEIRMTRLLKKTDLNHELTPHSLRHTHTSILAELGFELVEIMDRLGHTNDETTVNVYLHVTKGRKKETANKFSELINGLRLNKC